MMMTTTTMMALLSDPMQGMAVIMEMELKYVLLTHYKIVIDVK
jgi:hypothetical protein